MNDAYYEQLVSRKSRPQDLVIRILTIVIIAAVMVITFPLIGTLSLLITVALAFGAYYLVFPKLSVEYEYVLLNHDLEIDAIYSKSKRKKQMTLDLQTAEIIAPAGSHELDSFHAAKTIDYTSGNSDNKSYAVMTFIDQKNVCILIEPDETMLNHMKSWLGMKLKLI